MKRFQVFTRVVCLGFFVALTALVLVGCPSAGADGSGVGSGGDGTTTTGVPDDSRSAVDGSAYGYLNFVYFDGDATWGYNTDVYLLPSSVAYSPELYLWLNDNSDSAAIDPGTYQLDLDGGADTLEDVEILGSYDMTTGEYSYIATVYSQSEFEQSGFTTRAYDQITGGSVTVANSGGVYTFSWTFQTADGDSLSGSYSGSVDLTESEAFQ